jgi:hypothetical protein
VIALGAVIHGSRAGLPQDIAAQSLEIPAEHAARNVFDGLDTSSCRGRRRGRPHSPRIGGIAWTSGNSCVTSLRLPPVMLTSSGSPPASQIRWCLQPARARSTGEGPTWAPL